MTQVSATSDSVPPLEALAPTAGTPAEQKLTEKDLGHWKLLQRFRQHLDKAMKSSAAKGRWPDSRRADYLAGFLFCLLNPVTQTLRGFVQAGQLEKVRKEVCAKPFPRSTFSDAQHLLDPELLDMVFKDLSAQIPARTSPQDLGPWNWMARDGSLFRALPRMTWALYGAGRPRQDKTTHRAVRLHLSLHLQGDKPVQLAVRPGRQCERAVWEEQWEKGAAYVGDRYFGENYQVFERLENKGCAYVLRLMDTAVVQVEEELAITQEDRDAHVERQAWARLGHHAGKQSMRLRLVWLRIPEGQMLLATNLGTEALSGALVSQLYRKRWQIETFFRWIKCILRCGHWIAESQNGATIQIYLAVIAALLLQLYTGRRPNLRMTEMIQYYLLGVATEEELQAHLQRYRREIEKRKKS